MNAPDKIYVPIVNLGIEEGATPSPIWWRKDKRHEHEEVVGSVIYIRKDALLEWAKTNKEKCGTILEDDFWQEVIDKLNSL